jgi:hypothetical protein
MSIADLSEVVPRARFGLKSLFLLVAAVALVLAPMHWFGGIYLLNALLSVGLIAACMWSYGSKLRPTVMVWAIGAVVFGFVFTIASLVFFFHALLNLIFCVPLMLLKPRQTVFAYTLLVPMAVVYGLSFKQGAAEVQRLQALKARFPFESLSSRLAFEKQNLPPNGKSMDPIHLNTIVTTDLYEQDDYYERRYYGRARGLRELHENARFHFARAAGFGFARMGSLTYMVDDWEPRVPFEMPYGVDLGSSPDRTNLYGVHRKVLTNFASPDRMGYARNVNEVAGFESHGLEDPPKWQSSTDDAPLAWHVTRLELVSLLRHEEPRVYVAKTMPEMDKLADIPTRALSDFEKDALTQIATQKDIVFRDDADHVLMVGALRAGKTCLECHEGQRGKLLGAFSYEITPIEEPEKGESAPPATQSASSVAQAK